VFVNVALRVLGPVNYKANEWRMGAYDNINVCIFVLYAFTRIETSQWTRSFRIVRFCLYYMVRFVTKESGCYFGQETWQTDHCGQLIFWEFSYS